MSGDDEMAMTERERLDRAERRFQRARKHMAAKLASLQSHVPARTYRQHGRLRVDDGAIEPAAMPEWGGVNGWAIAFVSGRREPAAIEDLAEAGYSAWTPMLTAWITRGRTRRREHRPLFPGYVFVGLRPHVRRAIIDIEAVGYLVHGAAGDCAVHARLVERLAEAQAAGRFDRTAGIDPVTLRPIAKARRRFEPGQIVRVVDDTILATLFGRSVLRVVRMKDAERVVVMLRMLGSVREMDVSVDRLEAAE